jgi:sugar (pentulose or hexulose) kinase
MSKKYIIGVDGGSQSSKVIIFDLEGNIVCEGKKALRPMHLPKPGIVEHPDDDLWHSIVCACNEAMDRFPGDKKDIIGIGLCTIRFCRALLKEDGTLAQPVMSWMDERVSRPYEHINPEVKYVTTSSGYITHRFTGNFNDTAANYQGMWPIDTDSWRWSEDEEVFKTYQIPREMLFNLQDPGTILGYVTEEAAEATGVPVGIPVVATANDKAVEALGAGLIDNSSALISLGTYITGMVHGEDNPKNTKNFWTNFASIPNRYLYESNGIRRGMWTVSWFKDLLGEEYAEAATKEGILPEERLNREAIHVPPGSDGLMTVLDWLAPTDQPYKKGVIIGFDARHTRAHIYRSILEGIALTMKNNIVDMCTELNIKLDHITISGGGSNSNLMMQIFADVFGLQASRNVVNGAAGLGAAICVAVAVGAYSSFEEAVQKMVRIRDTFQPNSDNNAVYSEMNEKVYQHITKYTDEVTKRSYPIFN